MRYLKLAGLPVLVLAIAAAFGLALLDDDSSGTRVPPSVSATGPSRSTSSPTSGASEVVGGDESGSQVSDRSREGAMAAAVGFLELTEEVVSMSPADGAALQRSISTEAAAERLSAEVADTLRSVQTDVPEGVLASVATFGVDAVERGDGWDVSIWYVEVIVYGDELAVEQWRTSKYSLEWESDGWRMSGLESIDGPTPVRPAASVASSTASVAAAVSGMDDGVLAP